MLSLSRALDRWLQAGAPRIAKQIRKFGRLLQKHNGPRLWVLLAICQSVILLLLLLNWPVTVSLLLPQSEKVVWSSLIEEFQQQNPNIRIALVEGDFTTDDMEAIYSSDFSTSSLKNAKPAYDLLYLDIIWVRQFAKSGHLKDLTELVSKSELAKFLPKDVEVGQYQDKLYWLPLRSDVGVLFYRADLLAKAGYTAPPQTFQDLLEMSQQIQAQRLAKWGYVWQGRQYEGLVAMFEEVLAGYGGFWIQPETNTVGLDQQPAIDAVNFLRRTIQEGISPNEVKNYNEEDSFNQFAEGETVFLRNWPFIQPRLEKSKRLRNRVKIAPMVHIPGATSRPCKGGWGLSISSRAAHPRATRRVIKFFTSEAAQRKLVLASGYLPSRRSLFSDPELLKQFPYLSDLEVAVNNSVSRPLISGYKEASDILQRYLSNALAVSSNNATLEAESVKALMKKAAEETRNLLMQNR